MKELCLPQTVNKPPNIAGSAKSLAIAGIAQHSAGVILIITPDILTAAQLEDVLRFFTQNKLPIFNFPDWETLPYDKFSPHRDIISQRLKILNQL